MPKLNDLYPSKWLKADDLPEEGIIVTIRSIDIEKMNDGVEKPVVYFDEIEKGLVCNKTNATIIGKLYGDDTDAWEDERVTLYPTYVDFKGEQVESIRVKPKKPKAAIRAATAKGGKTATPLTQAEADAPEDGESFDGGKPPY